MSRLVLYGKTVVCGPGKIHTNAFVEVHDGKVYRLTNFSSRKPDVTADVIMPGFIDPHVHCRDWGQSEKETIKTAGEAAVHGGVTRIHDMPNTSPPIIHHADVEKRIESYKKSKSHVEYGLYCGLTGRQPQIREAVEAAARYDEVVGLKMYAGESFGGLGVTEPRDQLLVYRTLSRLGYRGVLMVHCEKVSRFRKSVWSVNRPETWCDIRPPEAEIESVRDQIDFALKSGFKGRLHICHSSLPETVSLARGAKSLKISCGATPHHLLLSHESMQNRSRGLYYKVNPPLRKREHVQALVKDLYDGNIDWIETDHAPHRVSEKLNHPFSSGMPGLDNYSNFITALNIHFRMPFDDLVKMTSFNAAKAFRLSDRGINPGNEANLTLIDMKPETVERRNLKTKCGWSPYEGMHFPGRTKATIIRGKAAYLAKE
jgi:dihydroorotase